LPPNTFQVISTELFAGMRASGGMLSSAGYRQKVQRQSTFLVDHVEWLPVRLPVVFAALTG
jgi:hypothetical protein